MTEVAMSKHHTVSARRAMLLLLVLAGASTGLFAQRYVYVPRGHGTLNDILVADSVNRVNNPNTVYLLERGDRSGQPADSNYVLASTITAWGSMPLQIRSYGAGPLPRILPGLLPGSVSVQPSFNATADLYMTGVYLTAKDVLGAPNTRTIVSGANGIRIVLDSCAVNGATQSTVRAQHDSMKVYLLNTVVSNMNGDMGNGRVVDNRGIFLDTLVMRNCAIYRTIRRVYREGGGRLGTAIIEHNTFDEITLDVLMMGNAASVTIQNNLFVDCGFFGNVNIVTGIEYGSARIRNNLFYADTVKERLSWPVGTNLPAMFDSTARYFVQLNGDSASNIFSPVAFTMAPNNLPKNSVGRPISTDSIAKWYYANPGVTTSTICQVDSIQLVDFAYDASSQAWTLGNDGRPAGCLLYFPPGVVGVDDGSQDISPQNFSLDQNYPNPFNPSTAITFSLSAATHATLRVYNLLGQEVGVLINGQQEAGSHTVKFDAISLSSGIYFYELKTPEKVMVKKMMVVK